MTASPPNLSTTVITLEPVDYGEGPTDRITFVRCKYRVDESGTLHVFQHGADGNVATFAPGHWSAVIRGTVVKIVDDVPTGQRLDLKAVQS